MTHKHQSNVEIAAAVLRRDGHISAYQTVYNGQCECGESKRNTRLADTIWRLRNEGWDIETKNKPNMLADYVLIAEPGDVEPHSAAENPLPMYACPDCGKAIDRSLTQPLLGGYRVATCPQCHEEVTIKP